MKIYTLTIVSGLLLIPIGYTNGSENVKVKRQNIDDKEVKTDTLKDSKWLNGSILAKGVKPITKGKEIRKRGILHYGGLGVNQPLNIWPNVYPNHYGYNLPSHTIPGIHALSAPAISHKAPVPLLSATTAFHSPITGPFILRPGGSTVQSYNVNYPHRKPFLTSSLLKPIHGLSSLQPVQHVAVHSIPSLQSHTFIPNDIQSAVHTLHPSVVHEVHHPAPTQPITPSVVQVEGPSPNGIHNHHVVPQSPIPTVIQVHQVPNGINCITTTSHKPSPIPAIPFSPASTPTLPAIPSFPNPPPFPSIPTLPVIPAVPAIPALPPVPSIPTLPQTPSAFFPVQGKPPIHQEPPIFVQIAGKPVIGSVDASPEIPRPTHPIPAAVPLPEPGLQPILPPSPKPDSWKPTVVTALHPSHTLLPPFNNSPGSAYLPPSSTNENLQHDISLHSQLFDDLNDTEIEHIFNQANLAAQRDQQNHHQHPHNMRIFSSKH